MSKKFYVPFSYKKDIKRGTNMNITFNMTATPVLKQLQASQPIEPPLKYNKNLEHDTVSFGQKKDKNPKITASQIKAISENARPATYMKLFRTKSETGENIFWRMTPKAIKASADLLKKTKNEDTLSKALSAKNPDGKNILTTIKTADKLDALVYALKDDPKTLLDILSYPTPEEATATLFKNALIKGENEHKMQKSLNKAWFSVANENPGEKEAVITLFKANEEYLNKKNKTILGHLTH